MTLNASALPPKAFIETSETAAAFWQIGILWRLLATGLKTGGALCFVDEVVGDQPGGPVTHAHPQDEGLYLIDGHATFFAGGQTIDATAGTFVSIPRYTPHAFLADASSRFVNFYLPAGFEMLVAGLGVPARRNEAPGKDDFKLPPRRLVEKLSEDYGQIPVMGLPFADPPDPKMMKTEALVGAASQPYSIKAATAECYWNQGILWSILADGKMTDGSYTLFEELCPKGSGPPPHVHIYTDEVLYVLDGEADLMAGDVRQTVRAGALVYVPRGTVHSFKVLSDTARFLNLYSQAGFERLIRFSGEKAETRTLPPPGWKAPMVSRDRELELFAEIGMQPVALKNPFDGTGS